MEFLKSHRQFADSDPQVMPLYLESANAIGAAHESTCLGDEEAYPVSSFSSAICVPLIKHWNLCVG